MRTFLASLLLSAAMIFGAYAAESESCMPAEKADAIIYGMTYADMTVTEFSGERADDLYKAIVKVAGDPPRDLAGQIEKIVVIKRPDRVITFFYEKSGQSCFSALFSLDMWEKVEGTLA